MGEIIRFVPKSECERARLMPKPIAATGVSCRDQDHRRALQSLFSAKFAASRSLPPRTSPTSRCSPAWWARRSSPNRIAGEPRVENSLPDALNRLRPLRLLPGTVRRPAHCVSSCLRRMCLHLADFVAELS
jgi:hypothetical protein